MLKLSNKTKGDNMRTLFEVTFLLAVALALPLTMILAWIHG